MEAPEEFSYTEEKPQINIGKACYRKQDKPGWCGIGSIQMVALKFDIDVSQPEIALEVYDHKWGTKRRDMVRYLKNLLGVNNVEASAQTNIKYFKDSLKNGDIWIVNWFDDLKTVDPKEEEGGHYSVIAGIDTEHDMILVYDPTNSKRVKDYNSIYWMHLSEFMEKWIDIDEQKEGHNLVRWGCRLYTRKIEAMHRK